MKPIQEIYKGKTPDDSFLWDYEPLLDSIGTVLVKVDSGEYLGDSRIIYEKDGKYGYLQFGWGSCSGCDALKACSTWEEVDALRKELAASIKWFESVEEGLQFFRHHDWEGDYSKDVTFINKGIALFEAKLLK